MQQSMLGAPGVMVSPFAAAMPGLGGAPLAAYGAPSAAAAAAAHGFGGLQGVNPFSSAMPAMTGFGPIPGAYGAARLGIPIQAQVGSPVLLVSNLDEQTVLRRCFAQKTFHKDASILDSLYSDAEKEKILDTFNRCNEYELQHTRQLNHHKASSIVKHRKDNGNFQTLSDILLVPGVGILGIQKICNVLRTLDYETLQEKTSKADFDRVKAEPNMSERTCQNVRTLVTLDAQLDGITWTKIDRNLRVEGWDHISLFDKVYLKLDLHQFLEKLLLVKDRLPEADIYVMERKVFRNINPRMVPFLFNMKILDAMLFTLLNRDFESSGDHKIYMVAPTLVSQFFGLSVGGERVSGQHVLQDIQRMQSDVAMDVDIPHARWDTFKNLNNVQKEKYANSLLLGVAFYKLIVLRSHKLPL